MAKEIKFEGKELDANTRNALAGNVLVEGQRPITWWRQQGTDLHNKFMREMRTSIENGESTAQAATRITGGTIKGVEVPGIMNTAKSNANTLARTSINKVTNEARIQSFEANADVVKALKQISTLDSKTSQICIAYDGQVWRNAPGTPEHLQPIAPSTLPFNGGPPRHFNCRSTLVPVLKSWEELGIPADELSASTRASMDGQVPDDTTFDAFLKSKGTTFQNNILGPTKAKLWRAGKITLQQLVNFRGTPLTTEQLLAIATKRRKIPPPPPAIVVPPAAAAAAPTPPPVPAEKSIGLDKTDAKPAEKAWHKRSWLQGTPDYLANAVQQAPALSIVRSNKRGSFYQPKGGTQVGSVSMDKRPGDNSLRSKGTWRHEYGHHLDWTYGKELTKAQQVDTGGYISSTFWKKMELDAKEIRGNVDIPRSQAKFDRHLKRAIDSGDSVAYIDKRLKRFGFSYQELRDLHVANMDDTVLSPNDGIMRNKMLHILTSLETKDMNHYLVNVWWEGGLTRNGIGGKLADYYGSMTAVPVKGIDITVGWGHDLPYYRKRSKGHNGQTTEGMANVVAVLGAEPQWKKFMGKFGAMRFFNEVDNLLKEKGK